MNDFNQNKDMMLGYTVNEKYPNIYCFSTTRHGGVSQGNYASMNCTQYTGDNIRHIQQNQELLRSRLPQGVQELIIPFQTHSTNVLPIDKNFLRLTPEERTEKLQQTDALITDEPGICICISTADCIPLLLYDTKQQVTAAIHAGWKGTAAKIVPKTIGEMTKQYGTCAADIVACVGPGISVDAYEVGNEVITFFEKAGLDPAQIAVWHRQKKKYHLNLPLANKIQLQDAGVLADNIYDCGICTYQHCEDFFSARRLGIHSGRILSGIIIQKKGTNHV